MVYLEVGMIIGVILALGVVFFFIRHTFQAKKGLSAEQSKYFHKHLKPISSITSPKEQIIECDKLYHKILLAYGYEGTFGEILKQTPSIIPDIESVWDLHKLRNKLVHDFDTMSESMLKQKSLQFQREVKKLL